MTKRKEREDSSSAARDEHADNSTGSSGASAAAASGGHQISSYNNLGTAKYLIEDDEIKDIHELRHECVLAGNGRAGDNEGQFRNPYRLAIDEEDNIIVADRSNHRIQVISSEGALIRAFGHYGSGDGEFQYPCGVAVDRDRQIYVADTSNDRIQVFSFDGGHVRSFGSRGSGSHQLSNPLGIALGPHDGHLYVCDFNNHRVQVFTTAGEHVRTIAAGEIRYLTSIAMDQSGRMYITSYGSHNVIVVSNEGRVMRSISSHGNNEGQLFYPYSICIDERRGHVIVGDNNGIQVFNQEDGAFICKLQDKTFLATGVCVDSRGRIVACNCRSHTIERWS